MLPYFIQQQVGRGCFIESDEIQVIHVFASISLKVELISVTGENVGKGPLSSKKKVPTV